jgi:hypothetical protein
MSLAFLEELLRRNMGSVKKMVVLMPAIDMSVEGLEQTEDALPALVVEMRHEVCDLDFRN